MTARWWAEIRWRLRGVGVREFRALCGRCGQTGQAHWTGLLVLPEAPVRAVLGLSAVLTLLLVDWASGVAFTLAYGIAWAALAVVIVGLPSAGSAGSARPSSMGSSSLERYIQTTRARGSSPQ